MSSYIADGLTTVTPNDRSVTSLAASKKEPLDISHNVTVAEDMLEKVRRAHEDADRQAAMPVKQGIREYRSAVIWSALMTCTLIMESYDYSLMGSLFGFPEFAKKYGDLLPSGKYNISAGQQTILKQITKVGQIVGLYFTGSLVDRLGYKWTMLASCVAIAPAVVMQFLAPNINVLIGAQFLLGIPLAPFLTLSNVYAAEVAPPCLQPYLTSATTVGWSAGSLISSGVLRGLLNSNLANSYRIAFAVQWVWLLPMMAIVWFAPESPLWCVKTGRTDRARAALQRLSGPHETVEQLENRLAMLEYTDHLERENDKGTSYLDCFRGVNARRTEIACMVYSCQNLDGYDVGGATTYFFQQAGLSSASSFDISIGLSGVSIVASLFTWWIMRYYGRRPLYIAGLAATVVILLVIGGLGIPEPTSTTGWATGGMCFLFKIVFYFSQGPLNGTLITDVPSGRLRAKTVVIARAAFICSAVFMVVLVNYQVNVTAWNWRGKAGFFWGGSCFICTVWAYFRLPETKDRTPAQIDRLFMDKVPARKFASAQVQTVEEDAHQLASLGLDH